VPDCGSIGPGSIDIDAVTRATTGLVQRQEPAPAAERADDRSLDRDDGAADAARWALDLMDLELEMHQRGADNPIGKLVRQLQATRSQARKARADSLRAAENLAATEDKIAITLVQLAAQRPEVAGQLMTLAQTARMHAVQLREHARRGLSHQAVQETRKPQKQRLFLQLTSI
jgi:hypothetical protein